MSLYSLSNDPSTHWSVSVFQVSSAEVQQRVLRAFRHIDRPGVSVLRAQSEDGYFVIVDSERLADAVHAQRVIMVLDRYACHTYSSREHGAEPVAARLASVGLR